MEVKTQRSISTFNSELKLKGFNVFSIAETQEMLEFCKIHNITADIELIKAEDINEAFERLERGDVRYRFVIDASTF